MSKFMKPYVAAAKISRILIAAGKDASRSSKRTDAMNSEMVDLLKQIYVDTEDVKYTFLTEEKIKCSRGKTFKIDIVVKKNNVFFLFVHLKGIVSSYNKNRHNYTNTTVGEVSRLYDFEKVPTKTHSLWIDWIPNEVPVYDKKKNLKYFEKTNVPKLSVPEKRWNKTLKEHNCSVCFGKIKFDWPKNHKVSFKNVEGVDKIETFLKGLK